MATYNSTQEVARLAPTLGGSYPARLAATDFLAKERLVWFDYTSPASGTQPTTGDKIYLNYLPANCRVLGGKIAFDDLGTAPNLSLGAEDLADGANGSDTYYSAAIDTHTAAGKNDVGDTIALGFGEVLTKDRRLYFKVSGGAVDASVKVRGYLRIVEQGG